MEKKSEVYRKSVGYRIFNVLNIGFMFLVMFICLYPFLYTVAISLSSSQFVMAGEVGLLPKGMQFGAYLKVFNQPNFIRSYFNTFLYTVTGVGIGLILMGTAAYVLSRKDLMIRTPLMIFIFASIMISGGLIPQFVVVNKLGLYNTMWAILLPTALNHYYMILMMSFFKGIPESLIEAARIDGYNHAQIFFKIIIPLSKPVIATISLFMTIYFWNSWFPASLYFADPDRYPVMLVMRNLINAGDMSSKNAEIDIVVASSSLRSAGLLLVSLPLIIMYPFMQKYFVKGVTLGAIKG